MRTFQALIHFFLIFLKNILLLWGTTPNLAETMYNLIRKFLVTCLMWYSCEQVKHKQQKTRRHTSAGHVKQYETTQFPMS